ncbi:MAG TPA: cytochrome c3 family protein [Terriglobia bacterium]|nr:cytochrome c3 family protein [Terriglobia bacterium]
MFTFRRIDALAQGPEGRSIGSTGPQLSLVLRLTSDPLIFMALVALVLIWGEPAAADIHPVPLDKDTDAATCASCHENKVKGKVVHAAITVGCNVCHEVRVSKDITRVKLVATTPVGVCLTCHADKNAAEIKGTVHSPGVRDCLKCHDPHTSDNKSLLLKPTSGDEKENLCLSCHQTGIGIPEKGSRHSALDAGCDSCHVIHKSGAAPEPEFRFHLAKASPVLCLNCHDVKDIALAKVHQNQPFEKSDCLSCHDPHQSSGPGLMQKFVHMPFDGKQCDACHQPAKDGKVVLTQATAKEVCVTCHADQARKIENAKTQHPGALGDCTDCHSPHAGNSPGFPKPDAVGVCLSCHADKAEEAKKRFLHQPAFQQGCATCHEPHGGDRPNLLRADGSALCLECHGPDAQPQKLEQEHLVAIFDGAVRLPQNYFAKVPVLPLKNGLGHPTINHPVSNAFDPKTKTTIQITCLTCHQPHASAKHGLLVKDQGADMAFCKTCHKEGTRQLQ